jgi:hypothetical protein
MEICDDEPSISSLLHSEGYCPGWTPERTFDWDVEVTGEGDQAKGKGIEPRDAAAVSCNGVSGGEQMEGARSAQWPSDASR